MTAAGEWHEYHLTPAGWVEGLRPVPRDRVFSLRLRRGAGPDLKAEISFCAKDIAQVRELVARHGLEPHPDIALFSCDWQTRTLVRKGGGLG